MSLLALTFYIYSDNPQCHSAKRERNGAAFLKANFDPVQGRHCMVLATSIQMTGGRELQNVKFSYLQIQRR